MQVEVHDVEARGARAEAAEDRVHVRAVHVGQRARGVDGLEQLDDAPLEEPERRRVGEHDRRGPRTERGAQRVEVDAAVGRRRHGHRAEAGHRGRRRVRAVRGVGHDDLVALDVAAGAVVRADDEDARQLAVGAGRGLERDRRACRRSRRASPLELPQQLERALRQRVGRERMERREAAAGARPTR